jgi:hypothetical protein
MDRIDHVIEIAKSSHHMPMLLSFLMGLFVVSRVEGREEEVLGDNVPTTLIEGLGR